MNSDIEIMNRMINEKKSELQQPLRPADRNKIMGEVEVLNRALNLMKMKPNANQQNKIF